MDNETTTEECPNDCDGNGICDKGKCLCRNGYIGDYCQIKTCFNQCSYQGKCIEGKCYCETGFKGQDCSERDIKHGIINENGDIECFPGYTGMSCEKEKCINDCNGNGICDKGICYCDEGFGGDACEKKICVNNCSNGNGICKEGKCFCNLGFKGEDCSIHEK